MSTWILLRGWTRESAHWGRFPAQLDEALLDARVDDVTHAAPRSRTAS